MFYGRRISVIFTESSEVADPIKTVFCELMMILTVYVVYIDHSYDKFYKNCTKSLEFNFCFCLKFTEMFVIITLYSYVLCTNLI